MYRNESQKAPWKTVKKLMGLYKSIQNIAAE